jgi:putative membrane protein
MKRALLLATAVAAAMSFAACGKRNAGNAAATGNTTEAAAGNVSPGQTGPVNEAQNATSATSAAATAALATHDTGAFVDNLVRGNNFEIQAAKIAEQKTKAPDVLAFARMMVRDHTALGNEAQPVIMKAGKTAPTDLDPRLNGLLDNLRAAGPNVFDKTYIDQQVTAHQETLDLLDGYAKNGDDAGLKQLATKARQTVVTHLDRGKHIQAKLASAAAGNSSAG